MLSKKFLVPVFAVLIVGATLFGVTEAVHAQTGSNPLSGLAQAIAQKFNLNQSDVQNVITTYQQQHKQGLQQNMQQRLKTKLDQEVQQGKITSTQEQAIQNEMTTLQSKYNPQSFQSMTAAQRKQAMQNRQSDLKSWAQSQGIDISLIPMFGRGRRIGWQGRAATPTISPTPGL